MLDIVQCESRDYTFGLFIEKRVDWDSWNPNVENSAHLNHVLFNNSWYSNVKTITNIICLDKPEIVLYTDIGISNFAKIDLTDLRLALKELIR